MIWLIITAGTGLITLYNNCRSYEQAGLLCKDNKMMEDAIHLMEHAAKLFQENGTPDTAALTLDKAAK